MKKLLIVTGPQGSGNHMWSKVFGGTPGVKGWEQLQTEYWIGHGNEPFANIWEDPTMFSRLSWEPGNYVTSISCPYQMKGGPTDTHSSQPKYDEFIEEAIKAGFNVKLAIIGRDKNILEFQQNRLRKTHSTPKFLEQLNLLWKYNPVFISTELLYLYKEYYLKQISQLLDFPIDNKNLESILADNANKKYLVPVKSYWLDDHMKSISHQNGDPNNPYKYRDNGA
jgi:hypothetical protein